MSAPVIRLGARHKQLAYATFALLWASGALWLLFHYFFGVEGDFGPEPHPLEKWWLRLHGLAAMLALVALGSLLTNHVRLAWQRNKNRNSGLPMLALTVWLATTGYALYYFSSDANAAWLPLLHWTVGLTLPAALAIHILAGRQRAPRVRAHMPQSKKPALHVVAPPPVPASQKARS
ncbi:MAG: hypothetical protein B7Y26_04685 [Hydrogenophilales bacterium 16-64-46]|nr:MAG: hypothetical protein B7Z32_04505 [Hydrogenophilales bacterium 12-64-13]OYZ06270.1 MAG: hypothetical protein B7Y26_04685 [Hydrogenophilales bacterium 16-64-46]OZA38831.1 MAG: hypothetical protein B7X87_05205 [Hydrogenophilales bacterium 17-64-34]